MDNSFVDSEIRANKIKEGILDKRSKFLKEWRDRWVVLTQNYLFTFKSKVYVDPTDILDIRTIKSIKSYVKHYEDRDTCAFKLTSEQTGLYFRCKGSQEKWSWIVAIERLMDYRNNGKSAYNDVDAIRNKGFDPVNVSGGGNPPSPTKPVNINVNIPKEVVKEVRKQIVEQVIKPVVVVPPPPPPPVVQPVKPVEQSPIHIKIQGNEGPIIQQDSKVSQLKQLYEKKNEQIQLSKASSRSDAPSTVQKSNSTSFETILHHRRTAVVEGLFGEFETKNIEVFQTYLEFLVNIANNKTGYGNYVIYESKNHKMRKAFSELFMDTYTEEVTQKQAESMLSFLLIAFYESPGLFDANQLRRLKKTVLRYISTFKGDPTLILSMKAFVMLSGAEKYDTQGVRPHLKDLQNIENNSKNDQLRGLARKIREQASL